MAAQDPNHRGIMVDDLSRGRRPLGSLGGVAEFAVDASGNVTGLVGPDGFALTNFPVSKHRAGVVAVDWAAATIGSPTAGWTVTKETDITYAGKTTLKVVATAGAADTLICSITVPSCYFGGAKRICFAVKPGDSYIAGDSTNPVQLWIEYSASTTHRILSYANASHAVGDWAEGTVFDSDATGSGHISGTTQWAKVATEDVTVIRLLITKRAGQAIDTPLYVGPIVTDPLRDTQPTVSLFFDGQYSGQHKYARQILGAYGLRASLGVIPYWIDGHPSYPGSGGHVTGTMTLAQLINMYDAGHEFIHHTGTVGPTGAEDVGWDNTTKYPDGYEYAGVLADVVASQTWMRQNGFTRGIGYGVVGFTNGLVNTQTLARRTNISTALRDAGMLAMRQLTSTYNSSHYGCAEESCLLVTPSQSVTSGTATATVIAHLDSIEARGGWSGLTFHDIVLSGATGNNYNVADLETVIDNLAVRVKDGRMRVLLFSEAMRELSNIGTPA